MGLGQDMTNFLDIDGDFEEFWVAQKKSSMEATRKRTACLADVPPYSRLFVLVPKTTSEKDLHICFSKFGEIEDVWMVRDKRSGISRGICYIKYSKASEAAIAMECMNGYCIDQFSRPLKVLISNSRREGNGRDPCEMEKMLRLFVVVPKHFTRDDLYRTFQEYGGISSVQIVTDRLTGRSRGLGYVKFFRASDAAKALEECDAEFKPKFADPLSSRKCKCETDIGTSFLLPAKHKKLSTSFNGNGSTTHGKTLLIECKGLTDADDLKKLFDLIPGLKSFRRISLPDENQTLYCIAHYDSNKSAGYAYHKLHKYCFPSGQAIIVKSLEYKGIEDCDFEEDTQLNCRNHSLGYSSKQVNVMDPLSLHENGTTLLEDTGFCSVHLPPEKPLSWNQEWKSVLCIEAIIAIPTDILRNVFCRFGNLIDASMNGEPSGFIYYNNRQNAELAKKTMNGQEIAGIKVFLSEVTTDKMTMLACRAPLL